MGLPLALVGLPLRDCVATFQTASDPCATLSMLTYYRTSRSLHFPFWAVCSLSRWIPTGDLVSQLEPTSTRIAFRLFVASLQSTSFVVSQAEGEGAPGPAGPVHLGRTGPTGPRTGRRRTTESRLARAKDRGRCHSVGVWVAGAGKPGVGLLFPHSVGGLRCRHGAQCRPIGRASLQRPWGGRGRLSGHGSVLAV